jgi:hypothetical protein
MRYLLLGLAIGFIANIFIILHKGGVSVLPSFNMELDNANIEHMQVMPADNTLETFAVKKENNILCINKNGELVAKAKYPQLASVSGDGKFFIQYYKVGNEIEFLNIKGERFWKMKSFEYPYISASGKLILLMNGDHSRIRISDYNGNIYPESDIFGRFCTKVSFSDKNDFGAVGFFDGNYYFISDIGKIFYSGKSPNGMMVKNIAVSSTGGYGVVHSGNETEDVVILINFEKNSSKTIKLKNVYKTQLPLNVNDNGELTLIESDYIIKYKQNLKPKFKIKIDERKDGQYSIGFGKGFTSVTFISKDGEPRNMLFTDDGTVLSYKAYPNEAYLVSYPSQYSILLRGSENLFGYKLNGL